MKNTRFKDFIREIKGNKGRFLSIFFIAFLGAAFFAGIRSSGSDMKHSADHYYNESNMMDIKVLSTLGLTDEDIQEIKEVDGVLDVVGGKTMDVMASNYVDDYAIKIIAASDEVNKVTLTEGRMPGADDECVMDDGLCSFMGVSLGDKIKVVSSGKDDDQTKDLKTQEFTIVGTGKLPYYMDLTRGTGTVGDGQLRGFICVPFDVFDTDVYTEVYVKIKGTEGFNTYSDEYKAVAENVVDKIEDISGKACDRRYEDIYSEANEKITDGQKEVDDGKKELSDAKAELDDGKAELEDAKKELTDAENELADAKAELDDGKAQLDDAKKELDDGKKTLDESEAQINESKAELDNAKAELESGEKTLADTRALLDEKGAELAAAQSTIAQNEAELLSQEAALNEQAAAVEAGWTGYNENVAALETKKQELEAAKKQLTQVDEGLAAVEQMLELDPTNEALLQQKAQLEATKAALAAGIAEGEAQITAGEAQLAQVNAQLTAAQQQIDGGRAQIESGKAALEQAKAQTAAGSEQLAQGEAQYAAGVEAAKTGRAQYEDGLAKWMDGYGQYQQGKADYEKGKKTYDENLKKWQDGQKEYEDGLAKYEDGLAEYNDGLKEWEDGNKEYLDSYDEAQEKISDAEEKLADAKSELAKLEKPEWYVLDRDKIQSCVSYGTDGDRIDSLGNVFPVIFFLVAALVSLTCMTRMVEEQRQQIGTMKALGYSAVKIAAKYIGYAFIATLSGALLGVLFGEFAIPSVVLSSYGILYTGLPQYFTPYNWTQGGIAIVLSVLCTTGATLAACLRALKEKPAELMRPEAPKVGRRIFLEHLPFIWKKLNFARKATVRNLFRYKKRFIMTIIGIGGCMGLLLVGFGLKDSITVVAQNQFIEIFMQDATLYVDEDAAQADKDKLDETIKNYPNVTEMMKVCEIPVTLNANDVDRTASIFVPKDMDKIFDFVRFRDRVTKQSYDFPTKGVALSEKTAAMMNVSVGDTISIKKTDDARPVQVEVETIVENYVQHYAFMTPETYERIFGEKPNFDYIELKYDVDAGELEDYEEKIGTTLLDNKACMGVSFTTDLEERIEEMLDTLNTVIWVLIVSAALLAFVVLYNLNSINITERRRELATLKVLGFSDIEVAMYIYRENILLTVIGIAAGCFIGTVLHLFTILTVEVDLMMFGRVISIRSYVICAALTALFSVLVNIVMYYHFKKINMVESLKSVE